MARYIPEREIGPVIAAARVWIDSCLVADGSVFSKDPLWTAPMIAEVRAAFVDHPDTGQDPFGAKLRRQLTTCSPTAKQLASEMLWALFLFPSNLRPKTKRRQILDIWQLSGSTLDEHAPELNDEVLAGIGSGGQGFNTNRHRELEFLLAIATTVKEQPPSRRRQLFSDYAAFVEWMDTVPQFGSRQFRHMLRYFAFPDHVERMSSNRDRRAILVSYGAGQEGQIKKWDDKQLDEALLKLRRQQEAEHPGVMLDFYNPPLKERWRPEEPEDGPDDGADDDATLPPAVNPDGPINLILYGPPGTGKTYWMQSKFVEYTDAPNIVDQETWLQEVVGKYSWRAIIAVTLSRLGGSAKVGEIRTHQWVEAKAKQRGRSANVSQTIWAALQTHTPESVQIVKYASRREPFIFSKTVDGMWQLLPDWKETDEESAFLSELLGAGPKKAQEPIRRYRVVTFHPSFSYEDFVRGIRPVMTDDGTAQFRNVDGAFKRICDDARANPSKRYAIFIDEINRANIAKVLGELIALIEPDKRAVYDETGRLVAGMEVQLPGSSDADTPDPPFGVPTNLDIFGTMNTADRSIALLDIALRRRFEFKEMEPTYSTIDLTVESVHLGRMLQQINDRLEFLLDREHRIGHAYLMGVTSLAELQAVFASRIIPLLEEYFFDDFSRVALVLETSASDAPFLIKQKFSYAALFGTARSEGAPLERWRHVVAPPETWTAATFRGLYDLAAPIDEPSV
jgi:5-methylcytosine-specific restriction protein B